MKTFMIRVGCCGWPLPQPKYFATFPIVEIQESFYNLPQRSTVERWRDTAPGDFEFVLKAPQLITHEAKSPTYRKLKIKLTDAEKGKYGSFKPTKEVQDVWMGTLELAKILRCRIVLFQCPASFTPIASHIAWLTAFFQRAERDEIQFAWEPRGGEWTDAEIKRLCRKLDLIHCVDPLARSSVWGDPAYFRLHGRGGYRYKYSTSELEAVRLIATACGTAYVLFNNMYMLDDAKQFFELIR
jgi:uncharacterized protein YecE (DUF72 family)